MKTLITTFAFAVMVFAFNPTNVLATEQSNKKAEEDVGRFGDVFINFGEWIECAASDKLTPECNRELEDKFSENEIDELDIEREVADSDNQGSTSAASADDQ